MKVTSAPSARTGGARTSGVAELRAESGRTTTTTTTMTTVEAPAPKAHVSAGWGAWVAALAPSLADIKSGATTFLAPADVDVKMRALQAKGVTVDKIGTTGEGRALWAGTVGHGPVVVTVIAGAHPDEPTGTLTGLHLLDKLGTDQRFAPLLDKVTLHVVPQANPDGAAKNSAWFSSWPDLADYFAHVARDLPKDDVEFGFPSAAGEPARPENAAIARWFDDIGEIDHHASLHSMFMGGGALFLVTAKDIDAHAPTLRFLLGEADAVGLPLHDKDRMGQKGFFRIGPGLQTAPTAEAMRDFFKGQKAADAFLLNSMQYVAKNESCPFSLVSEIPLVYDPRISSQAPSGKKRADVERDFANALVSMADRLAPFAAGLPVVEARLASAKSAAAAMLNDLSRYGDAEANQGLLVENGLNLLRREATLLAAVADQKPGPDGDAARDALDGLVGRIGQEFDLRFPPVEVQMRLQIASVLAGVFGDTPPVPAAAPTSRAAR